MTIEIQGAGEAQAAAAATEEAMPEGVRAVLAELGVEDDVAGGVAAIRIQRRGRGSWDFVDTFEDPEEFSIETVKARFGGGKYRARIMGEGGRYLKQVQFSIAGKPKPVDDAEEEEGNATVAAILEHLKKAQEEGPKPQGAGAELVSMMVPLMTAMTQAQAMMMVPLLEAVARKDQTPQGPSILEIMDMVERMVELRGGSDSGGYMDVVKGLGLPLLGKLNEMADREGAQTVGRHAPNGAPAPAALPAGPPPPPWVTIVGPHVEGLLQLATFHSNTEWAAGLVLDKLDDEHISFVDEQLQRGDAWRGEFFQYFPAAVAKRSWFEEFFDALGGLLEETGTDEGGDDDGDA